jgi:transcriptional regulator with XRE-family HTH domain
MSSLDSFFSGDSAEEVELTSDPELRRARMLVRNDKKWLRKLVAIRRERGLRQEDVAAKLGVTQATVAKFERYDNDPMLSTVRRYAQAVGAFVDHVVVQDSAYLFVQSKSVEASDVVVTIEVKTPKIRKTERAGEDLFSTIQVPWSSNETAR